MDGRAQVLYLPESRPGVTTILTGVQDASNIIFSLSVVINKQFQDNYSCSN